MKSEVITVGNNETLIAQALELAEKYVYEAGIDGKMSVHLNLLTEEILCMVRAMVGEFSARFWIEDTEREFRINVDAVAEVDKEKKKELLSVSSSGKNVANKGLMAKIGAFFSDCVDNYDMVMEYTSSADNYGYVYTAGMPASSMTSTDMWTLSAYRNAVSRDRESKDEAKEAWDELEKSVIANMADDVIVGVKDNHVTLTVVKKK